METKNAEFLNVTLKEEVPQHILRTEDDFDSDEGGDSWETDNSDDDEDGVDNGEEFEGMGDPGWADAMAKILMTSAQKGGKSVVLAKAKKITDIKPKEEDIGFKIDGEVKEEKSEIDLLKQEIQKDLKKHKISRRDWNLKGRLKPCLLEKNRERALSKIATKGVVQLFNAVRDHQKSLNSKLNRSGSIRKQEKVLQSIDKKSFLDLLMGSTGTKIKKESESDKMETAPETKKGDPSWNVLRDDFMMGANLKDWDKVPESNEFKPQGMSKRKKSKGKKSDKVENKNDSSSGGES